MIAISDKLRIMKGEVTVGLFKQVMQGYEIKGPEAQELTTILNNPSKEGEALTYVCLFDAREFAKRLSEQTGRKFRVQTEAEWITAKDKLSDINWTWTETGGPDGNTFVLCRLIRDPLHTRLTLFPTIRAVSYAIRLVEDISMGLEDRYTRPLTSAAPAPTAAAPQSQIELPEMVDISDKRRIMKGEITVGLFKQVMRGYRFDGHHADTFKSILDDPSKAAEVLTYVCLIDAREFAKRLSDLTGRIFRVPTNLEWEAAKISVGNVMLGQHQNWTETEADPSGEYFQRALKFNDHYTCYFWSRSKDSSLRLIEDIPPEAGLVSPTTNILWDIFKTIKDPGALKGKKTSFPSFSLSQELEITDASPQGFTFKLEGGMLRQATNPGITGFRPASIYEPLIGIVTEEGVKFPFFGEEVYRPDDDLNQLEISKEGFLYRARNNGTDLRINRLTVLLIKGLSN
ncbi:MAG: SUMF1/EgtB/PvdO family nonheme iron enzyme [Candidatus Margulisbacteria bacterium]|nr:SUMF1/EgtB/PvdO family nonheme iron enzyme [Candidatus Margulisiibacteriota bacterium]